jgi:hypothetical protein
LEYQHWITSSKGVFCDSDRGLSVGNQVSGTVR